MSGRANYTITTVGRLRRCIADNELFENISASEPILRVNTQVRPQQNESPLLGIEVAYRQCKEAGLFQKD